MRMKAKQMGFVKGARVRPGQEFNLPAGKKRPEWAVPVGVEEKAALEPAEPATFSELNRQTTAAEQRMLKKKMAPQKPEPTDLTD